MASHNLDHFVPDALSAYRVGHIAALKDALKAYHLWHDNKHISNAEQLLQKAYAKNAFASH